MSNDLTMLTLQTVNNVLTQSSKQILNEQTDYNCIINLMKTDICYEISRTD